MGVLKRAVNIAIYLEADFQYSLINPQLFQAAKASFVISI
jgi:hypothetical protein